MLSTTPKQPTRLRLALRSVNITCVCGLRDTGEGIAPQDQRRIFDRFVRVVQHGRLEGHGLGLSIVQAIVQAHGDDTKPFQFEELLARVRVQLRNRSVPRTKQETRLQSGSITLDLLSRQAWVGDRPVELSAHKFLLVEVLMRHSRQVMTREQLLDRIWGYDYGAETNVVNVYVGHLRRKLGENAIETVRGVGYRLRV